MRGLFSSNLSLSLSHLYECIYIYWRMAQSVVNSSEQLEPGAGVEQEICAYRASYVCVE